MIINIYFGKLIDKKYPRLYSQGNIATKSWSKEMNNAWEFVSWLIETYNYEHIQKNSQNYFAGNDVLVVSLTISEEYYFLHNGELARLLIGNKMDNIFNLYMTKKQKIE